MTSRGARAPVFLWGLLKLLVIVVIAGGIGFALGTGLSTLSETNAPTVPVAGTETTAPTARSHRNGRVIGTGAAGADNSEAERFIQSARTGPRERCRRAPAHGRDAIGPAGAACSGDGAAFARRTRATSA